MNHKASKLLCNQQAVRTFIVDAYVAIRTLKWMLSVATMFLIMACAAQAQTYSATGSMSLARYTHAATLLPNGTVLDTGGCESQSNCTATAEIYNPATGTYTATGSMLSKRWGHTATLLNNGMVLITGGCTGGGTCVASAELYNPATGTFNATGTMSVARYTHQATLLFNGMVLITGGCQSSGNCNATAELYNPTTGSFTATGAMHSKRYSHGATLLNNGQVLITGGCTGGGTCLATAELYNPATGTFTTTGSMSVARYMHTSTLLGGGTVLLAGGCSGGGTCRATAELYNPANGVFTPTGSMSVNRYQHTATLLFDGTVLMAGGCQSSGNCNATAELYKPASGTFSATGSMTSKRWGQAAVLLNSGAVPTSGGCTGGGTCVASTDLYHGPAPVLGLVSPKYHVLGVAYAPPGSKSSVDYGSSTLMGTSTTIDSSFTKANTETISATFTAGSIFGLFGNEPDVMLTATSTTMFSQEQDSSSTTTINKTSSFDNIIPGPASDFVGVDHDFDVVYIWLNPVLIFGVTPSNPTNLQFTGFAFDMNDPISISGEMDVVGLQVAQLKNPSVIDPATLQQLARTWAPDLADGSGPGLTNTDLLAIAAADPFSDPTYTVVVTAQSSPCSTDGRFCNVTGVDVPLQYMQPAPGGQPQPVTFSQGFELISMQGQGFKDKHSVGFSLDAKLTNGFLSFFDNLQLKTENTLTWENGFSQTSTNTTGQTAKVSITPPPCNVPQGGNACNPLYTGPTVFNVFEDTVYRTFMFNAAN